MINFCSPSTVFQAPRIQVPLTLQRRILPVPISIPLESDLELMRKEKGGQRLWDLTFTYIGSSIGECAFKVMDCLCVIVFLKKFSCQCENLEKHRGNKQKSHAIR